MRLTIPQLILAVGIAVVLQLLELLLVPELMTQWPIPETTNYVSWLGTIAQIGGVFIALYFTAVTAAAGAIYAQVPNNIRDLLARERVGNIYIRYLTLATFLPIGLVAVHFLGFEPIRIAVPFVVLASGVGIVAFATLGRRAFDLFDPTRLASSLFVEFGGWLAQASAGGFRWEDRSFQTHAHRQTASVADTLQTLSDLAAAHANLDSAPLLQFSTRVLALLAEYQQQKLRIPTASLWFEQRYEHRSWYQTEDSTVQLAHQVGINLDPSPVPEYNWLENRLQSIPLKCFQLNVDRKRLDNVRDLLAAVDAYVAALARNGNVRGAISFTQQIQSIYEGTNAPTDRKQQDLSEDIGLADAVCLLQIRTLVAYSSSLEQRAPALIKNRLERIRWDETSSLYTSGFVTEELRQLEWLLPRIRFELNVEGTVQTPIWYQQELVSKSQAENLSESVNGVIESAHKFFQDWSDRLVKANRIWQSAAVLSRYLEFLSKLEPYHLSSFKKYADSLGQTRRLTDLPWPDIKPERWFETVRGLRAKLALVIANHVVPLSV